MEFPLKQFIPIIALSLATALDSGVARAKDVPPSPSSYVLDEPHVLSSSTKKSVASLFAQHERLTGEQVVVAVFDSIEGEDLVDFSNRVFKTWKIGQRTKNNGILLALYWKEHLARIEVGYGLEPLLTDAKSKDVLEDFLIPELKNGQPDRAVSTASLEILRIIESPLIQDGKAQQILKNGGLKGPLEAVKTPSGGKMSFLLLIALVLLIFVVGRLMAPEAHYSGRGWYRPNPWRRKSVWWGDGGGGGFGGGGFSGGGGLSGGGGASGRW